jgi:hypothetical protein
MLSGAGVLDGFRPKGPGGHSDLQGLKRSRTYKGSLSVSRPVTMQGALT